MLRFFSTFDFTPVIEDHIFSGLDEAFIRISHDLDKTILDLLLFQQFGEPANPSILSP